MDHEDASIDRFQSSVTLQAIDMQEDGLIPTRIEDSECINCSKFVGRLVEPLDEQYAGRVEKYFRKRGNQDNKDFFTVKYYRGIVGEGRAKKVSEYTLRELLPLLVVSDRDG